MGIVEGITVFVLIWLLMFFAFFFPWTARSRDAIGKPPEGAGSGALAAMPVVRKVLLAGLIAAAIWLVIFAAVRAWNTAAVFGGIATYLIIWWLTFFAVLPWGVRSQHEHGERLQGTEPGAPIAPGLGRKALVTSFIAAAIWLAVYAAVWTFGSAVWDYYDRIVPDAPQSSAAS